MKFKSIDLEKDSISKLFFNFSFPAVMGMLISAFYVIIDGIFIGRGIGGDGLAAINVAYPVITLTIALSLMFGTGGATIISIKQGEGNSKEVNRYFSHMVILNIISYLIICTLTLIFQDKITYMLGSSQKLFYLTKAYLIPGVIFSVFFMLSISLNAVVRNDNSPNFAMISMIIGAITNVILDALFILKFQWGMYGAAYATGIAQTASALFLISYFFKKDCKIKFKKEKLDLQIVKRICLNGFPSFVLEFAVAVITVLFNSTLMVLTGEIGVAAFSIIAYIFYVFRMIFNGLAQGIQPIISYNFGAKHWDRIKATLILGHKISLFVSVIILSFVYFKRNFIVEFFNGDLELVKLASRGLLIYSSAVIFLGANFINISYLQSMEKSTFANFLSFGRSFVFITIGIFTLPSLIGIDGVWLSLPFADFMTFLTGAILSLKNKIKKIS
ncbi:MULTISPECIES: MATE family efflux transporter [Cetobacterium]|uniref:Multidrug export protein MepA n=1 Tax=Candidatus Cetobacterium colombiensis TaxID=3073100 RepID=A0ABU4W6B7_9FUSO|nr:MATE family efflux transporter [Candidatus Cetobacterium colombiensis]MDX8335070.1 MATE family efflux transporter [Candidatus Cetobacterium colombiensis]